MSDTVIDLERKYWKSLLAVTDGSIDDLRYMGYAQLGYTQPTVQQRERALICSQLAMTDIQAADNALSELRRLHRIQQLGGGTIGDGKTNDDLEYLFWKQLTGG